MAGIGLGTVVRFGDRCCYSPAMKHLWRRTEGVGGPLDSLTAARLVMSDPTNDVCGHHADPLGACLIDENDAPLVI
jgi:hypothetical protein